MTTVGTIKMTAQQFLQLGEDPPGVRLELVDGEIVVTPSPIPEHSYSDLKLGHILMGHIEEHDLGELFGDVDTIFGEHDVRRPDLIYFRKDRLHLVGEKAMEGPPDLCVEVLSPGSGKIDRRDKFKQYAAGGVEHYWIVDPKARTFEAYQLRRGKYVLVASGRGRENVQATPFPDLVIPLGKLWRPR